MEGEAFVGLLDIALKVSEQFDPRDLQEIPQDSKPDLKVVQIEEYRVPSELERMDKKAKEAGFLVAYSGELYWADIMRNHSTGMVMTVIIEMNKEGTWDVWRETFKNSKRAVSMKDIAKSVPFSIGIREAQRYATFFMKK